MNILHFRFTLLNQKFFGKIAISFLLLSAALKLNTQIGTLMLLYIEPEAPQSEGYQP